MKSKAEYVKCIGEAHQNPYIDHCEICMPFWGDYPVCPIHRRKLTYTGFCKECRKHYITLENPKGAKDTGIYAFRLKKVL